MFVDKRLEKINNWAKQLFADDEIAAGRQAEVGGAGAEGHHGRCVRSHRGFLPGRNAGGAHHTYNEPMIDGVTER